MARMTLRLFVLGALLISATACKRDAQTPTADTATPQGSVMAAVQSLKSGDIKSLVIAQVPPQDLAKMKAEWKKDMDEKPPTDKDRAKFVETMTSLTAPDAEAKLMAQLEPQLVKMDAELVQQMPMYIGLGRGLISGAIQENKELTAAQKEQALKSVEALAKWAETTKFTDRERAKRAIAAVVKSARELGMKNLDEMRALTFEQTLDKGSVAFRGLKQALDAYGISLDATLDSVKTELVPGSEQGDTAKVKVSYTFLGAPIAYETEMVKIDGHWYGKQAVEQLRKPKVEKPAAEPEPAAGSDEDQPEDEDKGNG